MSSEKIIVLYQIKRSFCKIKKKKKGGPGSGTSLMMVYPAQPLTDHPLRL